MESWVKIIFRNFDMNFTTLDIILSAICFLLIIATILFVCLVNRHYKHKIDIDSISGLYTPNKFKDEAQKILLQATSNEYSFVCIDINNFQYLADTLGRDTANAVLKALGDNFKKVAPKDSLLCRRYADNFVMLIHSTALPVIEDYVLSMIEVVSKMGSLLPLYYTLEFSSGVYPIKNTDEDIEIMLHKANSARKEGLNSINPGRVSVYDDELSISTEHEKEIIFDMNRAFEANEFVAYYQPKFSFSDGKIIGAEALVRWNHHEKGILLPGYFVPLFEKNGFISKIDLKVFESVCQFLDKWNKSGIDGTCPTPITISCNLSRYQLYNPSFAKEYSEVASKYQIEPSKVELELTESLMMDNKKRLLKAMNEIKKAGFDISIDDFGAGFSSLSLLKDLPARVLKLDREFLANTATSESENNDEKLKDRIIVTSVIDMAKKLQMTTVAEGVEEKSQADFLKEMGCDIAQGFLYAKPMNEEEFWQLLQKNLGTDKLS